MVKPLVFLKLFIITIFFVSCNIDFFGIIKSSDLDERLADKDNFVFLDDNSRKWRELELGNGSYSFIVLSDTLIEDGKAFGFDIMKNIITSDVKFMVHLGNITQYGSSQDIKKFIDIADSFGIPCYPIIGNHDFYFNNWSVWKRYIGSTNYRIDGYNDAKTSGVSLFILDSGNSFFGKEQLDWLENEIKSTNENVFVFTHSPLFVTGPADMQQITDTKERARLVSILKDKCGIMFMGHLHKCVINETGNVRYIGLEDFLNTKTYCLVKVNGLNVTYEFKKLY